MRVRGFSRIAATNAVAKRRGTTPQTVIDKYCRQLNKKSPGNRPVIQGTRLVLAFSTTRPLKENKTQTMHIQKDLAKPAEEFQLGRIPDAT